MPDTESRADGGREPKAPRAPMAPAKRNAISAMLLTIAVIGLYFTVRLAVTGRQQHLRCPA
ncbi:MAG: hypothetical protein M5U19_19315 [Microthrixaceae bacterium]|nr:hypothetical protein [Microthrixaceae bacterium]